MTKTLNGPPVKQTKPKGTPPHAADAPAALLVQVGPGDPIEACVQNTASIIEVDQVKLDSPALIRLKENNIHLAAPLILHGKLVGLLNLGPRLYEQELSAADRQLLTQLANQAVSATRVAEWLRSHPGNTREHDRLYQDLRVARLIQEALLPRQIPNLKGWHFKAISQLAEIVGGDFFDFLELPDHRMMVMLGDVCNKGIPSALVMATSRSILRAAAREFVTPERVLRIANELLVPDTPVNMFVTCFYGILDPASGRLQYANAGHPLPIWRRREDIIELDATGMPLGLMPNMTYEEKEITLQPGESLFLYSDGVSEAHNPRREMVGTRRIQDWVRLADGEAFPAVLSSLREFTGQEAKQEDDITLLALERLPIPMGEANASDRPIDHLLAEFELPSEPGNERLAADKVVEAVRPLGLSKHRMDQLRTAVAETALNAMEHGNHYRKDIPTSIRIWVSGSSLLVRVTDAGGGRPIPNLTHPDLQAKLAGLQSPRGWGLFLIRNMVDEMRITSDETHHTVELVIFMTGGSHGS